MLWASRGGGLLDCTTRAGGARSMAMCMSPCEYVCACTATERGERGDAHAAEGGGEGENCPGAHQKDEQQKLWPPWHRLRLQRYGGGGDPAAATRGGAHDGGDGARAVGGW